MIKAYRHDNNPILSPDRENAWESCGVFNGCVIKEKNFYHIFYRAQSLPQIYRGINNFSLSSIGHAISEDGINFSKRLQLIKPVNVWERYGCEDPRVTKFENKFYIFYTALSSYPFGPGGIKTAVALTSDFSEFEKHPVTPFNSKAMALFPQKVDGKIAAILTINTDLPPAKICLALFDKESDIWSLEYWDAWYSRLNNHIIPFRRKLNDHVEVGAPPIRLPNGWLVIYSYIRNYFSKAKIFGIEAVLLDLNDPTKIIARIDEPLLMPSENYELYGKVPNIVFPSGASIENDILRLYYGAADTTCCLASFKLQEITDEFSKYPHFEINLSKISFELERFPGNPIITPNPKHPWENQLTFNPSSILLNDKVHIVYRAMNKEDTSVFGYAVSSDGFHIDKQLEEPIYKPREKFEKKEKSGNSGCEDPRITEMGDKLYLCYTAYDGINQPRVALSTISFSDFIQNRWNWTKPVLISPPGVDDKDACILSEKINGKFVIFHRFNPSIWIDFKDNLDFTKENWIRGKILLEPRVDKWDSDKIGIGAPPLKTPDGWLLVYHGLSAEDRKYRLGAILLDLNDPSRVISRLDDPILEPEVDYEMEGMRPGTVFTDGIVVINNRLFVYYGASDEVVCVATADMDVFLDAFRK